MSNNQVGFPDKERVSLVFFLFFFFFNDTATTEIYTLSLHDALPILDLRHVLNNSTAWRFYLYHCFRSEEHTSELQSPDHLVCRLLLEKKKSTRIDPHTFFALAPVVNRLKNALVFGSVSSSMDSSLDFFFNDTATTEIYTLSLHDALPIYFRRAACLANAHAPGAGVEHCPGHATDQSPQCAGDRCAQRRRSEERRVGKE